MRLVTFSAPAYDARALDLGKNYSHFQISLGDCFQEK